jgi:selenocysteine lyase/cysteine desulfurase
METLEKYFEKFRENIVGINAAFKSPYGIQKIIYADWIASGRLYGPIEDKLKNLFGPLVGNTHSEASETGVSMTLAYKLAHKIIKQHVNANDDDIIITAGSGMTGVVNKFQRILGLKVPEQAKVMCKMEDLPDEDKPVVFITHLEHHSNQTSWLETFAEVVVIEPDENLQVKPDNLRKIIGKYENRKLKIGSFSACSNVTGIMPPVHALAKIMHENGGYCFADYAASAPYVDINMHPEDPLERLDAIYFSPHKALGGPGSSGVLIFNKDLYHNYSPDNPGGGTVTWTNRWGEFDYVSDIEAKEDGGTPSFLQTMRAALTLKLKEDMGTTNIREREEELMEIIFERFEKIPGLHILSGEHKDRIGVVSFYVDAVHHNLIVKLLNDRFGIQVRGGCSCAGTYGHFLLNVDIDTSHKITAQINSGDLTLKPGWVRLSIHPTMTNDEVEIICGALEKTVANVKKWGEEYYFDKKVGEFFHKKFPRKEEKDFKPWFEFDYSYKRFDN